MHTITHTNLHVSFKSKSPSIISCAGNWLIHWFIIQKVSKQYNFGQICRWLAVLLNDIRYWWILIDIVQYHQILYNMVRYFDVFTVFSNIVKYFTIFSNVVNHFLVKIWGPWLVWQALPRLVWQAIPRLVWGKSENIRSQTN